MGGDGAGDSVEDGEGCGSFTTAVVVTVAVSIHDRCSLLKLQNEKHLREKIRV